MAKEEMEVIVAQRTAELIKANERLQVELAERRRAEEALRTSERLYRTLAHNFPNGGVALFDRELRYMIADGSDLALVGLTKESLEGRTIWEVFSPEVSKTLEPAYRAALAGETTVQEVRISGRVYLRHAVPVTDERGEIFAGMVMSQDITERKVAEELLRQSEKKFSTIFQTIPDVVSIMRLRDGLMLDVNDAWQNQTGYLKSERVGKTSDELNLYVSQEVRQHHIKTLLEAGEFQDLEAEYRFKDGSIHYGLQSAKIIELDGEQCAVAITRDITAYRAAEEAVRRSEAQYRALVENTPDIIARFDRDCRYVFVNSAVKQVSDLDPGEFVGKTLAEVGFSAEQASFREQVIRKVLATRTPFESEFAFDGANGPEIFEWRVYPEFDASGDVQTVLSINRNITERKRVEDQARRSREQLRALSAHVESVREEERTTIAREIHDELGQALTGLKMDLSAIKKDLEGSGGARVRRLTEKTASMSELIDATIQAVRRIATELRPGILDDLGLVAAIEWQAQDFENRTGIKCSFTTSVEELDLEQDSSTAAFRILQETLTNVARHSGATVVEVSLKDYDDVIYLEIRDNGKGISEADISGSKSLGLLGMRERAQLLGGDLEISGVPGEGTTVTIRIPVSPSRWR